MSCERSNPQIFEGIAHLRHSDSSRSIHPYFGKVDPSIAIRSIEALSARAATVLDPFCGSGTVLHDSLVSGRSAIGWDSSPLAVLISTGKVLGVTTDEAAEVLSVSKKIIDSKGTDRDIALSHVPPMPRVTSVESWFNPAALHELGSIKHFLQESEGTISDEAGLLLKIAFSRIVVQASNQQGESTYRRVRKSDEPGRVLRLFERAVFGVIKAARALNLELEAIGIRPEAGRLTTLCQGYSVRHQEQSVSIFEHDARSDFDAQEIKASISLVVTSPPYLMSWDYGLYHKFRFYWLGFDLNSYEGTEIGRHLRRKNDDVERYCSDMGRVFNVLHACTAPASGIVMVNAPSIVHGEPVDTNALLVKLAQSAGWHSAWSGETLDIPGPHHGMYGSLAARGAEVPGQPGKRERVLIFGKA